VSEVQGEGNIIVYSDMCLSYMVREMLLCKIIVSEIQDEGSVTVYSEDFLVYRLRKMLL